MWDSGCAGVVARTRSATSTIGASLPPLFPLSPIVRSPRDACTASTFGELPDVEIICHVAFATVRLDQTREDSVEAVVVSERGDLGRVGGECKRGDAARSWRSRPVHSAARCWASAADPPLPKSSTRPPRLSESVRISAARSTRCADSSAKARATRALSSKWARTRAAASVTGVSLNGRDRWAASGATQSAGPAPFKNFRADFRAGRKRSNVEDIGTTSAVYRRVSCESTRRSRGSSSASDLLGWPRSFLTARAVVLVIVLPGVFGAARRRRGRTRRLGTAFFVARGHRHPAFARSKRPTSLPGSVIRPHTSCRLRNPAARLAA